MKTVFLKTINFITVLVIKYLIFHYRVCVLQVTVDMAYTYDIMFTFCTRSERMRLNNSNCCLKHIDGLYQKITMNLLFLENVMIFDRFTTAKAKHYYTNIKCQHSLFDYFVLFCILVINYLFTQVIRFLMYSILSHFNASLK